MYVTLDIIHHLVHLQQKISRFFLKKELITIQMESTCLKNILQYCSTNLKLKKYFALQEESHIDDKNDCFVMR